MTTWLIYGFLGSGKTTLIKYLLKEVLTRQKVVILENESGQESVDGDFLRNLHYRVVDITSGCVCCTLRNKLPAVLAEIERNLTPDYLLIEPSGLAALEELLSIPNVRFDTITSLLSATQFDMLMKINPDFYQRQIRLSPVIFLTHGDQLAPNRLAQLANSIERISPCSVVFSEYRSLSLAQWGRIRAGYSGAFRSYLANNKPASTPIVVYTMPINRPLTYDKLDELFQQLKGLLRAKGVVSDLDGNVVKIDFTTSGLQYQIFSADQTLQQKSLSFWFLEQIPPRLQTDIKNFLDE